MLRIKDEPDAKLVLDSSRTLTFEEYSDIRLSLTDNQFWDLDTLECGWPDIDGSSWTVETSAPFNYAFRRSPEEGDPIRIIGEKIIELADSGDVE